MKKDKKWAQREVDRYLSYEGVNEARNALMFAKGVISQLEEPEKPVIPKFVADWIEVSKKHYSIGAVFHDAYDGKLAKVAIEEYIFENQDLFAQAWLDGYEVEKEKLYYVLDSEDIPLLERANNQAYKTTTALSIYEDGRDNSRFALTEKEIEDYDDRFWQFAVPVEEVME